MKVNERGTPQIKICGLTKSAEASYLNEIHAEYAGFILWEKSKRNVSFAQAEEIGGLLDENIRRVAVTVSPDVELVREIELAGFDILQVHGELQEEIVKQCNIPIWRACNLQKPEDMEKLEQYPKITGYVIDAGTAGGGKTFDWAGSLETVEKMKATVFAGKTFVLAGGLNPENVAEAVRIFRPDVVDVSSGVEGTQGKERALIIEFAGKVRSDEKE